MEGWEGTARYGLYLGGLLATLLLYRPVSSFVRLWGYGKLKRRLTAKLVQEGFAPEQWGGLFVGIAPGDSLKVYDGFANWDVGFLCPGRDQIWYIGDLTRFALRRDQVVAVTVGAGLPAWSPTQYVYVRWQDKEHQANGVFSVQPIYARNMRQYRSETEQLAELLHQWQKYPSTSSLQSVPTSGLGLPEMGSANGVSPRTLATANTLITCLFLLLPVALLVIWCFGLSCGLPPHEGGWYVITVAFVATVFEFIPYRRYRGLEEKDNA